MPNRLRAAEAACMAGAPVSKGKRPLRALSASDKIEAIQRVNDGESKASVARQIGVPESTLRGWCKNEDKLRYMSSRHSTPETDKSSDGTLDGGPPPLPPEKRAKYEPGAAPVDYSQGEPADCARGEPERSGLDLSRLREPEREALGSEYSRFGLGEGARDPVDVVSNLLAGDCGPKTDPGAAASMSAASPLSGLSRLSGVSGLSPGRLGMSFGEIATNLSLIAQLNPSLSTLAHSINTSAKMLRSIRSPKPGRGPCAGSGQPDGRRPERKSHGRADAYGERSRTRSGRGAYGDRPADDALWYWIKKQQAALGPAPAPPPHPLAPTGGLSRSSASVPPVSPAVPSLDALNKNSWFWQYYKQFTGSLGIREERPGAPPKLESCDNILYSQLTREKSERDAAAAEEAARDPAPARGRGSPCAAERVDGEGGKNQIRVRAVLDNLLLLNNNNVSPEEPAAPEEAEKDSNAENEFGCEVSEALEHGEKFLKWLEACQEPSVTRMQVHQLKGLLGNIRANATRRNHDGNSRDRISRRK